MNLAQLQTNYQQDLKSFYNADEANELFYYVIFELLAYSRATFILKKEEEVVKEKVAQFDEILLALKGGMPIQYAMGKADFFGLQFKVDASVLIPRPETEELVDWIINSSSDAKSIMDIGTGSGCIAISLKKNLNGAKVYAIDISNESLLTATENASTNGVEVNFIHADILQPKETLSQYKFDVIVSNPPYIKEDEKAAMHHNVLANEPHHALFVTNEKPLIFYEAIADFALAQLNNGGKLFFEINEYLGKETVDMLVSKSFINIELRKDMQGKDRMILAHLPS